MIKRARGEEIWAVTKGKTEDTGAIRFMISENPQEVSMGGYGNDVLGGKQALSNTSQETARTSSP